MILSWTIMKDGGFQVFRNKVLSKIFVYERVKVSGKQRNFLSFFQFCCE